MGIRSDDLRAMSRQLGVWADTDSGLAEPTIAEQLIAQYHDDTRAGRRSADGTCIRVRSMIDTTTSFQNLLAAGQPVLRPFERRISLRDVVTVMPTTAGSLPFVRELSPYAAESAVSGVPEGTTKPDQSTSFGGLEPATVQAGVLAGNLTVSSQYIEDSPAGVQYLDNRLRYLVTVREEFAALYGAGEAVNAGITGVTATSGVASTTATGGLISGITKAGQTVANNGAIASAAFVNGADYLAAYESSPTWFGSECPVAVVPSTVVPAGTCVVGAFDRYAVLVDRQQADITVYDQHLDFRKRNLVLVQIEERVGFVCLAPWAFASVSFT